MVINIANVYILRRLKVLGGQYNKFDSNLAISKYSLFTLLIINMASVLLMCVGLMFLCAFLFLDCLLIVKEGWLSLLFNKIHARRLNYVYH